jgi:RNA polymerase sigma factor (sigma-70 family)
MLSPDPSLASYLDQIGRHPLLTAAEERRLGARGRAGDAAARRRLVECNLRLVVSIARHYEGNGLELLDLVQEGNLGLMTAAARFDPSRGTRFAGYAGIWIRQAICRALSTQSRLVRVPVRLAASSEFRRVEQRPLSLHEQAGDGDAVVFELLRDASAEDPSLVGDDPVPVVRRACDALGERRRRVLELRFGLDGRGERSLGEVAEELGVSRERARRLQESSLYELAGHPELSALRAA